MLPAWRRVPRSVLAATSLLLAGCGARAAGQQDLPSLDPDPATPPSAGEAATATAAATGHLDIPAPLLGLPLLVTDVRNLALFDDERAEAAEILATWARSVGLTVVAPRHSRVIFARAASGQNAVTGKACGAPLWHLPAVVRWKRELGARGRIEAAVSCTPDCWLSVHVSEGADIGLPDAGRTAFYAAPYDTSKPWRDELPLRLGQLFVFRGQVEPYDPVPAVPGAVAPAAQRDLAVVDGDAPELTFDPAQTAATEACLAPGEGSGLLLELDAAAKVVRCEGDDSRLIANVKPVPCLCAALAGQTIAGAAGAPSRRLTAAFRDPTATTTRRGLTVTARAHEVRVPDPVSGYYVPKVSDPSIAEWAMPDESALAACFADGIGEVAPTAAVTVAFGADGKATGATVSSKTGVLSAAQKACIRSVFLTAVAPCPAVATSSADAEVTAELRTP